MKSSHYLRGLADWFRPLAILLFLILVMAASSVPTRESIQTAVEDVRAKGDC
jgi:hypothetical protein